MRLAELKYMFGSRHDFGVSLPPLTSFKRALQPDKAPERLSDDTKMIKYFNYYQQKILPHPKMEFPAYQNADMETSLKQFDVNLKAKLKEERKQKGYEADSGIKKLPKPILKREGKAIESSESELSSSYSSDSDDT